MDRVSTGNLQADLILGGGFPANSISDAVTNEPQKLAERVTQFVRQYRPQIIVFDSFKAIADLMPDVPTWRKVLYELAGTLSAYDTTSFWIGEYIADMVPRLPEFAVADTI